MLVTPFDIFVIIVALVAAALGYKRGFINQLGSLAGIIVGIICCRLLGTDVCFVLAPITNGYNPTLVRVLVYALMFLVAYFVMVSMSGVLRSIVHGISLGIVDRIIGAVYKMVLWIFLLSLLFNIWVSIVPSRPPQGKWVGLVVGLAPTVIGSASAQQLWSSFKDYDLLQNDEE